MITIRLIDGTWIADMSQSENASEIQHLFGTMLLPTPYTAQTSAATVQRAVQALNDEHVQVQS